MPTHWMTRTMWLELQANLIDGLDEKFCIDWVPEDTSNLCRIEVRVGSTKKAAVTIYEAVGEPWLIMEVGRRSDGAQFEIGNHQAVDTVKKMLAKAGL